MALMELVFLFGISLMYVAVGTLDIFEIVKFLFFSYDFNLLFFFSLFFILLSFFFKVGVFPFHFYVIDLYRTVSFYAIVIFSTLPKFVYFFFIIFFVKFFLDLHFFIGLNLFYLKSFYFFFFFLLLFSFFFVTLKVLNEFSLLTILAYSGISTFTLALLPLFGFDFFLSATIIYYSFFFLVLYSFSFIGFLSLLSFFKFFDQDREFSILKLYKVIANNNWFVFFFSIYFLSFSGLPFFMGFFIKFSIYFFFVMNSYHFFYFLFSFLSVISFFYTIRLLRLFFFDSITSLIYIEKRDLKFFFNSFYSFFYYYMQIILSLFIILVVFSFFFFSFIYFL